MKTTKPYSRKYLFSKHWVYQKLFFKRVTTIPNYVVTELEKIQKSLLWVNLTPKIKHDTLCNDYKDKKRDKSGIKNVDNRKKLQVSIVHG